jgi:hypothetical protein
MKQFDMTMADAKAVAPKRTFLGWLTNACLEFVVLPSFFFQLRKTTFRNSASGR